MANHMDLSGKLIIKAQLGEDIRLMPIHNEDITYDELVLMMQRVFRGKITSTDELVIKYKDQDNDLITIFDSSDLTFAIQCSRILKITLFVNGKPQPMLNEQVREVCQELQKVRDRVNYLLDTLGGSASNPQQESNHLTEKATVSQAGDAGVGTAPPPRASPAPAQAPPPVTSSKEFDPLTGQRGEDTQPNNVMSSFGLPNDVGAGGHPGSPQHQQRTGTPDSINSLGSSTNRTYPQAAANSYPQDAPQTMTGAASQQYPGQQVMPGQQPTPSHPQQGLPGQQPPGQQMAQQPGVQGQLPGVVAQQPGAYSQANPSYSQGSNPGYPQGNPAAGYSGQGGQSGSAGYPGSAQPGSPYTPASAAGAAQGQQGYPGYPQQQGYGGQPSATGQPGAGAQGAQSYSYPANQPPQQPPQGGYRPGLRYPTPQGQYPSAFQPR